VEKGCGSKSEALPKIPLESITTRGPFSWGTVNGRPKNFSFYMYDTKLEAVFPETYTAYKT